MAAYKHYSIEELNRELRWLLKREKFWKGREDTDPKVKSNVLNILAMKIKWVRHYRTPWLFSRPN
ncbi:MAG: hypothetical protein KDC85_24560 [Saprospiraceae bacterium]|nr:hypothetical protein [Saprospiraceae bacterium]